MKTLVSMLVLWPTLLIGGTFGYSTETWTDQTAPTKAFGDIRAAERYTASGGETVTKLSFYGRRSTLGSSTVTIAVYEFDGSKCTDLVGSATLTINSNVAQWWHSGTLSIALTGGTTYVVACGNYSDATNTRVYYYDAGSGNNLDIEVDQTMSDSWGH